MKLVMTTGAALVALAAFLCAAVHAAERPNILLIYTDDVGYGDIGCYGAQGVTTPNIDRLAQEGIKFTDAHATAATCTPSRYTLLTGSYAFRKKGARVLPGTAPMLIQPGTPTLPAQLQKNGYATGVVGKWHLGLGAGHVDWNAEIKPGPAEIGFDYHYLIPATGDRVPCVFVEQGHVVGADPADPIEVSYGKRIGAAPTGKERPDLLKMMWSHGHNGTIVNGISRIGFMTGGQRARWVDEEIADVLTRKAVGFVEQHQAAPFFLYFCTHDIHVPRAPNRRFVGKSTMGPRGDAIAEIDWCVGQLLATLQRLGIAENTLVIFTSDNGPVLDDGYIDQANEKLGAHRPAGPLRAGKYSLFAGGTQVPMIVRWPAKVKAGTVSNALFGQVDLAASLAELTGSPLPQVGFPDSRAEGATLLGRDPIGRPHLLHEAGRLALRVGPWKFIPPGSTRDGLGPWRSVKIKPPGCLYNVVNDPGETSNVASDHPEQLAMMAKLLAQIRQHPDRR